MRNSSKLNKKNLKAYSLLEVMVSLSIITVCTIVMMNFMILSFRLTAVGLGRSLVREELSNVINLIGRDFKNSDLPPVCNFTGTSCDFYVEGLLYRWYLCSNNTKICKDKFDKATGTYVNIYTVASYVLINYFKFEPGFAQLSQTGNTNLILTISAAHSNQTLGINNIVKQASFSVRNYLL